MKRLGLVALLVAALALGPIVERGVADRASPPYPVDLRVVGGESAWHPEPWFTLEWSLPPTGAGDSPIAGVGYRLRDAAGALVREGRQAGDRPLLEVQVPSLPGVFTAEIWLEGPGAERGPSANATLRYDHGRPGTPEPSAGAEWIAGSATAAIAIQPPSDPPPVSGILGYAVSIDRGGGSWPCAAWDRCGEGELDLRGDGSGTLPLGILPEGANVVRVVAVSGAGVPSAEAGRAVVRVDATRPDVVLTASPSGWVRDPVRVVATATDLRSGMTPAGPNGPFTAIAVDGGVPRAEHGPSAAVTVTGEGFHRVDAYARDAAGNVDSGRPHTIGVAIDETPPRVSFANRQDPAEPERLEAAVSDSLSGAKSDRGSIAVRELGASRPWRPLPTEVTAGRLVARWDSDSYPHGIYEFKATAYDAAGNAASSERRANRTRMVLVNPLKKPVRLRAGLVERPREGGTVPYGSRSLYLGRLTSETGSPLSELPLLIVERFGPGTAQPQRSTRVLTGADGTFALRLRPGPSREVGVSFAGTRTLREAEGGEAQLAVRSGIQLRASARTARVGGAPIRFSGRVRHLGAPIPAGGAAVELQFRIPHGEWAEFRTVQTDARGRFRYRYAFSDDDSRGVRFQFRAQTSGGDWPYEPAASKAVSVTGR